MRARTLLPGLIAGVLLLAGCDFEDFGDFQRYQTDVHYSYPLKAGGTLSVETFNGSVEISTWNQSTVDIAGVKYGRSQGAVDALKIDIQNTPDSVSVRVVRPSDRRSNLGARFTIKIPEGALLDRITSSNGAIRIAGGSGPARLRTSNGQVRVEGLKGSLDASTSNGTVELLDIDGEAHVRTSNGQIRANGVRGFMDGSTSNGSIKVDMNVAARPARFETSNGSVDVTVPGGFANDLRVSTSNGQITIRSAREPNVQIMAHTSNSSVSSDFEVRTTGTFNKNRLEGTMGAGGGLLDLSTSNGSIRISRM